jgi:hypothetical protein
MGQASETALGGKEDGEEDRKKVARATKLIEVLRATPSQERGQEAQGGRRNS